MGVEGRWRPGWIGYVQDGPFMPLIETAKTMAAKASFVNGVQPSRTGGVRLRLE